MADRFTQLYQLPHNLYSPDSPVILAAGTLLHDHQTGKVISQLKFKSVTDKTIKALKVKISAFDVSGQPVKGVLDYQYLDLNVSNGHDFGSNKAILMPDPVVRSFIVDSIIVIFKDGGTWESSVPFTALPVQKELNAVLDNAELEKQYRLETTNQSNFCPQENSGLWQCACGEWNKYDTCIKCKVNKNKLFKSLDISILTEKIDERLDAERFEKEKQSQLMEIAKRDSEERIKRSIAQKEIEYVEQKRINKSHIKRVLLILSLCVAAFVLFICIYQNIVSSYEENDFVSFNVSGLRCSAPKEWELYQSEDGTVANAQHYIRSKYTTDERYVGSWYIAYMGKYRSVLEYIDECLPRPEEFREKFSEIKIEHCEEAYTYGETNEDGKYVVYYVLCNGHVFQLEYLKYTDYFDENELNVLLNNVDFKGFTAH